MLTVLICASLVFAVIFVARVLLRKQEPPPPLTDGEVRLLLASTDLGEIPEALRMDPPRPDVFDDHGFLQQRRYRRAYLPLLLHGHVARGLVVSYRDDPYDDPISVTYEYAWLDHHGKVRRVQGADSYDPMHGNTLRTHVEIIVNRDAHLRKGLAVTVAYASDSEEHVLYEALCIDEKK